MASLDNTTEATPAAAGTMGVDELSIVLRDVHAQNLVDYSRLLIDEGSTDNVYKKEQQPFWDIVVITAGDKQQKHCYQRRIDQKLAERSIPSRARYLVIEDPPNSKIGSGGSTCLVMKTLQERFPSDMLSQARTLLIHAGGYSTRLPHVSARGKVFTTLPQADKPEGIQVLSLKLVLYLHLLKSMPPGVFLTSADGIELFSSSTPFPKDPKPFTITALAHPSSTQIGSTHGVYLLQDPDGLIPTDRARAPNDQAALLLKCQRFLHKPSLDEMRRTPNLIYNNPTIPGEEVVYTDSCYYFDPHTANLMANVYQTLSQECDLEAWADVLSFQDTSSSSSPLIKEINQRQQPQPLKQALHDANVQLDVMVLNASKFYHLGTMQEFIYATCTDQAFMSELSIQNRHPGIAIVSEKQQSFNSFTATALGQDEEQGALSMWQQPLFIENCHVPPTAQIGAGSLLVDTNLYASVENTQGTEMMVIPKDTCMFTLQLQEHAFVTFTFSVNDDMKRAVSVASCDGIEQGCEKDATSLELLKRLKIFESVPVLEITSFALDRLARIQQFQTGQEQPKPSSRPKTMLGWVSLKDAARIARER
ncbi:hypothetical protein BGZ95_000631 [Linnemannia exigua]|uniref:GDP-fucose pyrophosphorylase domain-containing protein n=1 Tax=Linnemannia exigua TaxID=604196 RepID=A0AAD4D8J6_9FUNG|nr:hypothetical protein BGZ95_000631 [Linnemannia exigua]